MGCNKSKAETQGYLHPKWQLEDSARKIAFGKHLSVAQVLGCDEQLYFLNSDSGVFQTPIIRAKSLDLGEGVSARVVCVYHANLAFNHKLPVVRSPRKTKNLPSPAREDAVATALVRLDVWNEDCCGHFTISAGASARARSNNRLVTGAIPVFIHSALRSTARKGFESAQLAQIQI